LDNQASWKVSLASQVNWGGRGVPAKLKQSALTKNLIRDKFRTRWLRVLCGGMYEITNQRCTDAHFGIAINRKLFRVYQAKAGIDHRLVGAWISYTGICPTV
jgi:hypothetical protein